MHLPKKLKRAVAILTTVAFFISSASTSFGSGFDDNSDKTVGNNSSVATVNSSQKDSSQEKSYLVGLKGNVDSDKFFKNKSLDKKSPKKFKTSKSVAVKLNSNQVQNLKNDSDVLYVEADATVQIASTGPAKRNHSSVKHMKKDTQTIPWGIQAIGADVSLEEKNNGNKVKIAVLDTGCSNHPDLKVKGGVSFVPYTSSYFDDNGHGTHVTGTIAAQDNKIGVVGIAPKADIYAVKVIDNTGIGTYSQIIAGIEWAIDNKINIVNMSFGGTEDSQALHDIKKRQQIEGFCLLQQQVIMVLA